MLLARAVRRRLVRDALLAEAFISATRLLIGAQQSPNEDGEKNTGQELEGNTADPQCHSQ